MVTILYSFWREIPHGPCLALAAEVAPDKSCGVQVNWDEVKLTSRPVISISSIYFTQTAVDFRLNLPRNVVSYIYTFTLTHTLRLMHTWGGNYSFVVGYIPFLE